MRKLVRPLLLMLAAIWLAAATPLPAAPDSDMPDIRLPASALPPVSPLPGVHATLEHAVSGPPVERKELPPLPHPAASVTSAVPAATFFPVLPLDAAPDEEPELVPVASNHSLTGDHSGLTRAVIIIHDFSRDAGGALSTVSALAGNANGDTIILAPQFLLDSDIGRFADHLPEGGKMFARWPFAGSPTDAAASAALVVPGTAPTPTVMGWRLGGDSQVLPQQRGISSFTVIDLLLLYLADRSNFPDLHQIVVAGHGEGGDFVQRYAAVGQAPDLLDKQPNLTVRFVVMNPSSYLYFTPNRLVSGKQGLKTPDAAACPAANAWPYGLDEMPPYGKHVGASAIQLRYVTRRVAYLTGETVAKNDPEPDVACAAMLQGADRFGRFDAYSNYLNTIFGEAAGKLQSFLAVPATGYDAAAMLGSSCGMTQLFGDGLCAVQNISGERR